MTENFFGITDTGRQRQNNEDAFVAQASANNRYIIGCVIDGVGGYSGGEIAAAIARDTISQQLDNIHDDVMPAILDALNLANDRIWQEREAVKEHSKMACVVTLAVADIEANQFYFAHLGDTRLYLFRDGSLVKISHDQSFVGFLEDSGRLTEIEAMQHPKRNEIDKALGFKPDLSDNYGDIETGQSPFLPGDMLMLCSDGLTDLVNKATMTEIMAESTSLKRIGDHLIDAANAGGGKDNITVVLVKNDKTKQQYQATKPMENQQSLKIPKPAKESHKSASSYIITRQKVNKNKGWIALLLVLIVGLSALSAWLYVNGGKPLQTKPVPIKDTTTLLVAETRNPQEIKLQNAIDQSHGKLLVLSDTAFKSPVVITRSIVINRDSLHIKAKGNITFQADSGFKNAGFTLTSKTKAVLLDSLSFQSFNVAVMGYNQALQLKNVRFNNCKIPVRNSYSFAANRYVTGSLSAKPFTTDSIPKTK